MYLGGKERLAPHLCKIINSFTDKMPYCEPFVGGASVVCRVKSRERRASDLCEPLIAMWTALQNGWRPPESATKEDGEAAKSLPDSHPLKGFMGFVCSFSGMYFSTFSGNERPRIRTRKISAKGGVEIKIKENRSYNRTQGGARVVLKKMSMLQDVIFSHQGYKEAIQNLEGYFIYCDPPYANTAGYKAVGAFDSEEFWRVIGEVSKRNVVLVSEYSAPPDIICLKEYKLRKNVEKSNAKMVTDKLYIHPNNKHIFM